MFRFMASPAGTHWYHAHLAGLKADGLFGFFIVHRAVPEEHHYSLLINHWNHLPFNEFMTINPFRPRYDGAIAGTGQLMYSKHHWYTGELVDTSSITENFGLLQCGPNIFSHYISNKAP